MSKITFHWWLLGHLCDHVIGTVRDMSIWSLTLHPRQKDVITVTSLLVPCCFHFKLAEILKGPFYLSHHHFARNPFNFHFLFQKYVLQISGNILRKKPASNVFIVLQDPRSTDTIKEKELGFWTCPTKHWQNDFLLKYKVKFLNVAVWESMRWSSTGNRSTSNRSKQVSFCVLSLFVLSMVKICPFWMS